LTILSVALYS